MMAAAAAAAAVGNCLEERSGTLPPLTPAYAKLREKPCYYIRQQCS
jgi:hypothetical protein